MTSTQPAPQAADTAGINGEVTFLCSGGLVLCSPLQSRVFFPSVWDYSVTTQECYLSADFSVSILFSFYSPPGRGVKIDSRFVRTGCSLARQIKYCSALLSSSPHASKSGSRSFVCLFVLVCYLTYHVTRQCAIQIRLMPNTLPKRNAGRSLFSLLLAGGCLSHKG